ncbi:phosphopantetheine-binding protein [Nocardioides panaciterrulae]|uniref:Acyl carrier protein n=1 Tax=Nocardioides panaciterrulae TaxID=661492 RepID=A0A7Y9E3C9_9ACTN|nr:phosphopantetheine-binding protein [Nocardioides panaciterrulae]NYD40171.1 acyl carrier protein [Nocardioides panaciterrulae]
MNEHDARAAVSTALLRIVPDADLEALGDDAVLRTELELDSLDFLSFVEQLSSSTGRRIEEDDYPSLRTMHSCLGFLTG